MRCPKCGFDNPNDANYCINCGSKIEIDNSKICPKCGQKNCSDSVFCSACGNMLEYKEEIKQESETAQVKERANALNRIVLIFSIIGAAFTIIVISEYIALIGLTISTAALVILAIGLLTKNIKGSVKLSFALSIYGMIGNILWIVFLLWMLPFF